MIHLKNLIPKGYSDKLHDIICSSNFPWYYTDILGYDSDQSGEYVNPKISNPVGFTHIVYNDGQITSEHYNLILPIVYFLEDRVGIKFDNFNRIRIRRTLPSPGHDETMYNIPHVDYASKNPFHTLVYYVNDSDGDTVIFNEVHNYGEDTIRDNDITVADRFSPVKGDAVFFNGKQFHAGNNPIKFNHRTVINFDFTTK
jgi:hypothetical protein